MKADASSLTIKYTDGTYRVRWLEPGMRRYADFVQADLMLEYVRFKFGVKGAEKAKRALTEIMS